MAEVRTSIIFDETTYERVTALAHANFPTPKRGGNINAVIRALINQAYDDPRKFGLIPPEPGQGKRTAKA